MEWIKPTLMQINPVFVGVPVTNIEWYEPKSKLYQYSRPFDNDSGIISEKWSEDK